MKTLTIATVLLLLIASCDSEDTLPNNGDGTNGDWSIPRNEVFDGGPGKDGIPSLQNPEMIAVSAATYLDESDLVIGFQDGDDVRAYPHRILDWHEIINDQVGDKAIAINYCPLTGTGIAWNRQLPTGETTFGVSGLLYNTNLILYDRLTDSNWSQILLESVNGALIGTQAETFPLVETTWGTWKSMHPETVVVSTNTGHSRNYDRYPYGDYRTNDDALIFPVNPLDNRLPAKDRVFGVIINGDIAKVYPYAGFGETTQVFTDRVDGVDIVVAGNNTENWAVAFQSVLPDGTVLSFTNTTAIGQGVMEDNEGNAWDWFGKAISGPRTGQSLTPVHAFPGFFFSFGAFYTQVLIHEFE